GEERAVLGTRARGVLVTNVEEDGPADESGIEEGDLILEANGRAIAGPNDLGAVVRAATPGGRPLRVRIGQVNWNTGQMGNTEYVAVKLKD
ncbi:MAG: PDZ domain-containing protein, partial [Candidatus Eisenbacteria bacterium]